MVERLDVLAADAPPLSEVDPAYIAGIEDMGYALSEKTYLGRTTDYDCQACVSSDCSCNVCDF